MTRASFDVDELDITILREMYRGRAVNFAGIDPRLNATRVAKALRIGRARVAARLRSWKTSGFLPGYEVWLNPSLLGWEGGSVDIRVDHHRSKPELLRRLSLVDGVVSSMEVTGEWISAGVVGSDAASIERRVALIRSFPGVVEVTEPVPWDVPHPTRPITSLDLRIVRALRENPDANLTQVAARVGVSTRTMTRRYSDLVEDWSVWYMPLFDFRALARTVLTLSVTARDPSTRHEIARRIRDQYPMSLEFTTQRAGPRFPAPMLFVFVILPSSAGAEELERFIWGLGGVESVEAAVMVRIHSFPASFDEKLEAMITARAPARRGAAAPRRGQPVGRR